MLVTEAFFSKSYLRFIEPTCEIKKILNIRIADSGLLASVK